MMICAEMEATGLTAGFQKSQTFSFLRECVWTEKCGGDAVLTEGKGKCTMTFVSSFLSVHVFLLGFPPSFLSLFLPHKTMSHLYDGTAGATLPVTNFLTREDTISPCASPSSGGSGKTGEEAYLGWLDT